MPAFTTPTAPATFDTTRPTFGGTTRVCTTATDLTNALAACVDGDIIALQPGASFDGTFTLRNRGTPGVVEIRTNITTAALDAVCPPGTRMTPAKAATLNLATVTAASNWAFASAAGAAGYRLTAIKVGPGPGCTSSTGFVRLGNAAATISADVGSDMLVDRCWIYGSTDMTKSYRRGVSLVGPRCGVIDSYIEDFYDAWTNGSDSQAVLISQYKGPYVIRNNHLEGLSETMLLGGSWWGTIGTGTVSASAGTATFSSSQAGVLSNGSVITIPGGAQYTVSAFNGTTGCTLSGSPTFSASSFYVGGDGTDVNSAVSDVTIEYNLFTHKSLVGDVTATGTVSCTAGAAVLTNAPAIPLVVNNHLAVSIGGAENLYVVTAVTDATHVTLALVAGTATTTFGASSYMIQYATLAKNGFEIKSCLRGRIRYNIFENVAPQAQYGYLATMKSAGNPVDSCQDIEFAWNWLRYGNGGMQISGNLRQDTGAMSPSIPANRIYIHDNLIEHVNDTAPWKENAFYGVSNGGSAGGIGLSLTTALSQTTFDHNTIVKEASTAAYAMALDQGAYSDIATGPIAVTNSILPFGSFGMKMSGFAEGNASWAAYTTTYGLWNKNVFVGTSSVSTEPSGTLAAALTDSAVGYVDLAGGNYALAGASPYKGAASDLGDVGISDFATFTSNLATVPTGDTTPTQTATHLAMSVQPSGAVSGVALSTPPVVLVEDASNATVTGDTSTVSATLNVTSGTGSITAGGTKAAVAGIATFAGLTITGTGSGTLTFTDGSLTSVTSVSFSWGSNTPAASGTLPSVIDQWRPKPTREGLRVVVSPSPLIGTGGLVAVASNTVSVHIPVGRVQVSVLSLAFDAMVAAVGSGAITVTVNKVTSSGTVTPLTAATSIQSDVITTAGNLPLPMLASVFGGAADGARRIDGTRGDYLRVDITAAGTVTTQPQLRIVAELGVTA